MKKRFVSICLVLCILLGLAAPVLGSDISGVVVESTSNKGDVVLSSLTSNGSGVTLTGTHKSGRAGKWLTYTISDDANNVYGLGEMRTKAGGGFSVTATVLPNAVGKTLNFSVSASGSNDISTMKFECVHQVTGSDSITIGTITPSTVIEISSIVYSDPTVTISGTCSLGAGKTVNLKIVDADQESIVYVNTTSVRAMASGFSFSLNLPSSAYNKNLKALFTCTQDSSGSVATAYFSFNGGYNIGRNAVNALINEISTLISQCEAKGISVEYEKSNLGVMNRFAGFLEDYIDKGLLQEYNYNLSALISLGNESVTALKGYLNGTKLEKVAPIYQSSKITQDGQSFVGTMSVKGVEEERPMFLNGYGHWSDALGDISTMTEMGVNYIHYEVGPNSILSGYDSDGNFTINRNAINTIKNVFKTAEDNNVSVLFQTAIHYFPSFIQEKYPDVAPAEPLGMIPFNPDHPEVRRAIKVFLETLLPEIKDYKSFQSVSMANEPIFIAGMYWDYYAPIYQEFLENRYSNNIATLNQKWGTSFSSFDEVTYSGIGLGNVTHQVRDERDFNDSVLTSFFNFMVSTIKGIDSDIPVHVKNSQYLSGATDARRRIWCGSNYEDWMPMMDINGCDAWGIYGDSGKTVQSKTMWYDFLTSMKDAPVINAEDHILQDNFDENDSSTWNTIEYRDLENRMNQADMWQGAIHGRGGSAYWLWDKSTRAEEGTYYYNSNLTRRADTVAAIGKTNHDMNRLAYEISAIQQKPERVALLHSTYALAKYKYHSNSMYQAYQYLQNNGEKVYIVNDTYPEKLNQNESLELLVVPTCNYMWDGVWSQMLTFLNNGGKVLFLEYETSYKNELGGTINATLVDNVLNHSNTKRVSFGGVSSDGFYMTGCTDVFTALGNAIKDFSHHVRVKSGNGTTEWVETEYDGSYLVNLCNYGETTTAIDLTLDDDVIVGEVFDLTENQGIDSSFVLEPYETKMIRISKDNYSVKFVDVNQNELYAPVNGAITAKLKAQLQANASYVHMLAVYAEDGRMLQVISAEGKADASGNISSNLSVTVNAGNDAATCTVKSFLLDSLGSLKLYIPAVSLGK